MSEGRKDDGGKAPWHLLPVDAVRGIVAVLGFGAAKYGERNWEAGMAWSRPYAALQRHMTAWFEGGGQGPGDGDEPPLACRVLLPVPHRLRDARHRDR